MFSMTITTDNPSQFSAVMAALQKTDEEAIAPAVASSTVTGLTAPEASCAYEDAWKAFSKLAKVMGIHAAFALLKKFNANKITDLKPEDYAAFAQAATACIAAAIAWFEAWIKAAKD